MKTLLISALMALVPGLVMAQTAPTKVKAKAPVKSTAKKASKSAPKAPVAKAKAKAPAKVVVAKAQPASQHLYSAAPAITASIAASGAAAAAAASQTGTTDVMAIADRVYLGRIACAVWLQIANKSMLMNQRLGQRLADECMSSEQVVVAEAIKRNPPPSVLEPLPVAK